MPKRVYDALVHANEGPEAAAELAGMVRYQLSRARKLFERGDHAEAAQLVYGSLVLLKQSGGFDEALAGAGDTLLLTAEEAAKRGDSGRARALYELSMSRIDPARVGDVQNHIGALDSFETAIISADPMARAEDEANTLSLRMLVSPNSTVAQQSLDQTAVWLRLVLGATAGEDGRGPSPMELEYQRNQALTSGVASLVALSLAEGKPLSAIEAFNSLGLQKDAGGELKDLLKSAADGSSPSYIKLYHWLDAFRRSRSPEAGAPKPVLDAALLASSWSAARHGEVDPDTLLPFAVSLLEFEMGEVSAHVLGQLATSELSKDAMSFCLELGLQAILGHAKVGEIDAAERSLSELAPLLEVLKEPKFAHVGPGPAALSRVLAESELEAGRLEEALPRLEAAAETAPTAEGWVRLASLKLKLNKPEAALAALDHAVRLAQARGDLFAESVAETNAYKVLIRVGSRDQARARLGKALQRVLTLRSLNVGILSRAALERQLATILEHYGQADAVERAYSRALAESRANPAELRQTLIDTARSALLGKNVRMAREATHYALELGLESEDAIYIALWQTLLERDLSTESNGMPLQVFESAKDAKGWALHLRQWGFGKLPPGELMRAAKKPSERAEADFYDGMRATGTARNEALTRVVNVPTLSLIEASMAEALLRPNPPEPLPPGIVLP